MGGYHSNKWSISEVGSSHPQRMACPRTPLCPLCPALERRSRGHWAGVLGGIPEITGPQGSRGYGYVDGKYSSQKMNLQEVGRGGYNHILPRAPCPAPGRCQFSGAPRPGLQLPLSTPEKGGHPDVSHRTRGRMFPLGLVLQRGPGSGWLRAGSVRTRSRPGTAVGRMSLGSCRKGWGNFPGGKLQGFPQG